ncbi:hypothetical protein SCG7086_AP_00210 [Chlamydiales bacterium SCGC AG-110-P3]|nr:hypothetical protein SCG7086_AP_00210 [Chlamydiales bacterium SCGC AG-110-P3]
MRINVNFMNYVPKMEGTMKHWLYTVLAAAALSTTGVAVAEEYNHDHGSHHANGNGNGNGNGYCETECYEEDCCDDNGFCVWVDALIMKPCHNLRYAQTVTGTAPALVYSDYNAEWEWDFGFRVGAGFKLPCHDWSINAELTCFKPSWEESVSVAVGTDIIRGGIATNMPFSHTAAAGISSISTKMDVDYYTFDVVAAYNCCVCEALELTPYGGCRALWLDQAVSEINVGGGFAAAPGEKTTLSTEYTAYGVTGGLRWKFFTCYPFHVFGHFGISGVAGTHDLNAKAIQTDTETWSTSEECRPSFGVEGSIGALWECCAWGTPVNLGVRYEHTTWSNIFDPFSNGDRTFAMHGVSVRAGISF